MKITINTEVLQRNSLSLGEFLVLLMGYHDITYKKHMDKLISDGTISKNVFSPNEVVLSNNTKDLVAKILIESDEKVVNYDIDFEALAGKLQKLFPSGNKSGTTYSWRDKTEVIAFKLRTLVAKYGFIFTEEEAIHATKEYIDSFDKDEKDKMQLLKYFILRTKKDGDIDSMFMTIIENNR